MKNAPPTPPCDSCGRDVDEYVIVLKPLPRGGYQEVLACDNCKARYEPLRFLRIRLETFPYILDKDPPFWMSDTALYDLFDGNQATLEGRLSFGAFPLIEDFEVVLEAFVRKHLLEKMALQFQVKFLSSTSGYLTHFRKNDALQHLCREDFRIPDGTLDAPFIDFEQRWGWSLLIFSDEQFVYVLTYRETEPVVCYFPTFRDYEQNVWFKVEKSRYYDQWEKAIQLCQAWRSKVL